MPLIEVNRQNLYNMADEIDDYCQEQDKQMKAVDAQVKNMLTSSWHGQDAMEFGGKWEGVDAPDSVAVKMKESLQNYAKALRKCADIYERAQEDAYNKSRWILGLRVP